MPAAVQLKAVIVVATADFEVYHDVVGELRDRGAQFTTVEPGDPLPDGTEVVVVGDDDPQPDESDGDGLSVVIADPDSPERTVESALATLRGDGGRTVVGVDPGTDPGIAVLVGDTVVAAYQVPLAQAPDRIREAVGGATDPVVRIGDGARLQGARIVEALDDVRVELVDETGTTPHLGAGARGAGDVLAAVNIARIEGEVVESRSIEPTEGELQVIQNRSRERSGGRTIDEALARRVALGELTMDEALTEHAEGGDGTGGEASVEGNTAPSDAEGNVRTDDADGDDRSDGEDPEA